MPDRLFPRSHFASKANCLLMATGMVLSSPALAQPNKGYAERLEAFVQATDSMIAALADATLDSACLTDANFDRLTRGLDDQSISTAIRLREAGGRTLKQEEARKVCGGQRDHAIQLRTAMSSAETWATVRDTARTSAMLVENEEHQNGILLDEESLEPINSEVVLAQSFGATIPTDLRGGRTAFDALLTVSSDGYVTGCEVQSTSGSESIDRRLCRHAMLPVIHRPAFVDGKPTPSTTHMRVRFDG